MEGGAIELPKKLLRIQEMTFILPDDFSGTVEDAMTLFLEYRSNHYKDARYLDPDGKFSTLQLLLAGDKGERVSGDVAIYQLNGEKYVLMDATNPYLADRKKAHNDTDQ